MRVSDKPNSPEYKAFEGLLSKVLSVSKTDLNRRLEEGKLDKQTPKSSSRASDAPAKRS